MARITVEDCLEKEPNRFGLVLLASKRAKQILEGAPLTIDETKNKAIVTALREVAEGTVAFMTEADLAKRRAEEERLREEAILKAEKAQALREAEAERLASQSNGNAGDDLFHTESPASSSDDDSDEDAKEEDEVVSDETPATGGSDGEDGDETF